jgi:hypothetical protein
MRNSSNAEQDNHDYVRGLLPWYANDSLSPQESDLVVTHLPHCPDCQHELARCSELNLSIKANQSQAWQPSPAHFSRIMSNVDLSERKKSPHPDRWAWVATIFPWLTDTPRPARFALGLQGALVIAFASLLALRALAPSQDFRTLSQPQPELSSAMPHVRLVFSADISEREIRALLLGIRGKLVDGPSSMGVYTVALVASEPPEVKAVLAQLRGNAKVVLAEPVAPGAAQ